MGSYIFQRLGSVTFKLFAAIDLYSVNCGRVAANRSAGCPAEFENIVSKSGPVKTGPTVLVATALYVNVYATMHVMWAIVMS